MNLRLTLAKPHFLWQLLEDGTAWSGAIYHAMLRAFGVDPSRSVAFVEANPPGDLDEEDTAGMPQPLWLRANNERAAECRTWFEAMLDVTCELTPSVKCSRLAAVGACAQRVYNPSYLEGLGLRALPSAYHPSCITGKWGQSAALIALLSCAVVCQVAHPIPSAAQLAQLTDS